MAADRLVGGCPAAEEVAVTASTDEEEVVGLERAVAVTLGAAEEA